MPTEIKVYAQFPREVDFGSVINLEPSNWAWVHCLTIPVNELRKLQVSLRPYKWIRYAIGVVIGAQGDLSSRSNSLEIVDYNAADILVRPRILYYHLSDDEKQRMFPLDPTVIPLSEPGSSEGSSRRVDFHKEVESRDGGCCILTGFPASACEAVHLLPHPKGDEFISTFTQGRSRDSSHGDVIRSIDNVRNGIFLNVMTIQFTGIDVAFLPTPNFAMDTADVDPAAIKSPREQRYTTHLFAPRLKFALGGLSAPPSGTPLQISDSPDWPPPVLFDSVYASAVIYHFGTKAMKSVISSTWEKAFYPSGVVDQAHSDYYTEEWIVKQERKKEEVVSDYLDSYVIMPARFQQKREVEQEEKRRVRDKVEAWMSECKMAE